MAYTSKKLIEAFADLAWRGNEYSFKDIKDWFYTNSSHSGRNDLDEVRKNYLTRMNILRVRRCLLENHGVEWNCIRSEKKYRILEAQEDWEEVTNENINNLKGRVKTTKRRWGKMLDQHPQLTRDTEKMMINAKLQMIKQLIDSTEKTVGQLEDGE